MRPTTPLVTACVFLLALPAAAGAFPVTWGASWDGPQYSLQNLVNNYLGSNAINVAVDYIGHDAGDPDPFYWRIGGFTSALVREVANNSGVNEFGWYRRPAVGMAPTIDGINDGVVFPGPAGEGSTFYLDLLALYGSPVQIGFYLSTPGSQQLARETFYTDRRHNDYGWAGGPLHAPYDGDPQALVYDLTAIRGFESYLLAWEDRDYGGSVGYQTDNDFNDLLVELTPAEAIPEPSSVTLLGSCLIAAIALARRRRSE